MNKFHLFIGAVVICSLVSFEQKLNLEEDFIGEEHVTKLIHSIFNFLCETKRLSKSLCLFNGDNLIYLSIKFDIDLIS